MKNAPQRRDFGLRALTELATLNRLLSLAVVNESLTLHRRKFANILRVFRAPGVAVIPVLGILAAIHTLRVIGVLTELILFVGL